MNSDVAAVLRRHDPARWKRSLGYRARHELPYDASVVGPGLAILLDTTVYIDQLKGDLPRAIIDLIATNPVHHGAPALSELAAAVGYLDPSDARTAVNLRPIIETLERVPAQMVLNPSDEAWLEASIMVGILARIQGTAKTDRRKFLTDALLFLTAVDYDAVLISRNAKDFDLLLQMKPGARVLLYDRMRV